MPVPQLSLRQLNRACPNQNQTKFTSLFSDLNGPRQDGRAGLQTMAMESKNLASLEASGTELNNSFMS
jgi:hypothetical protein